MQLVKASMIREQRRIKTLRGAHNTVDSRYLDLAYLE